MTGPIRNPRSHPSRDNAVRASRTEVPQLRVGNCQVMPYLSAKIAKVFNINHSSLDVYLLATLECTAVDLDALRQLRGILMARGVAVHNGLRSRHEGDTRRATLVMTSPTISPDHEHPAYLSLSIADLLNNIRLGELQAVAYKHLNLPIPTGLPLSEATLIHEGIKYQGFTSTINKLSRLWPLPNPLALYPPLPPLYMINQHIYEPVDPPHQLPQFPYQPFQFYQPNQLPVHPALKSSSVMHQVEQAGIGGDMVIDGDMEKVERRTLRRFRRRTDESSGDYRMSRSISEDSINSVDSSDMGAGHAPQILGEERVRGDGNNHIGGPDLGNDHPPPHPDDVIGQDHLPRALEAPVLDVVEPEVYAVQQQELEAEEADGNVAAGDVGGDVGEHANVDGEAQELEQEVDEEEYEQFQEEDEEGAENEDGDYEEGGEEEDEDEEERERRLDLFLKD